MRRNKRHATNSQSRELRSSWVYPFLTRVKWNGKTRSERIGLTKEKEKGKREEPGANNRANYRVFKGATTRYNDRARNVYNGEIWFR